MGCDCKYGQSYYFHVNIYYYWSFLSHFFNIFFELTPGEQVIIGITSFFIWPIIKIQYFNQLLFDEKKKKDLRIEQTNDFDYKLTKISTNYNELLNSSISEIANE